MVQKLVHSGVPGLDTALDGGFLESSMVIVEGEPGTGKTTMGLQFICAGARDYQEPGVYVSFEELPEQIHRVADQYSYSLRQLERDGLVRIVGCSPKLFVDQIQGLDKTLRTIIKEMGAKRLVVDPVNLLHMGQGDDRARYTFYSLLQALRRLSVTALLMRERDRNREYIPIDHFVCDGIIQLGVQESADTFAHRTLRIAKSRSKSFEEREFVFRLSSRGMYVLSPTGLLDSSSGAYRNRKDHLEHIFSKVLSVGTITLFNISSLVRILPLKQAILRHRINQGDTSVIWSLSASTTIHHFLNSSEDVRKLFNDGKLHFVEHFRRPAEFTNHPNVINAVDVEKEEYRRLLLNRLAMPIREGLSQGEQWLLAYDVNDVYNLRGSDFIVSVFPELVAHEKMLGLTTVIFSNLNEMSVNLGAMLERTSDNVVRVWVESGYEYLQVVKAKDEWPIQPFIVEPHPQADGIRLL